MPLSPNILAVLIALSSSFIWGGSDFCGGLQLKKQPVPGSGFIDIRRLYPAFVDSAAAKGILSFTNQHALGGLSRFYGVDWSGVALQRSFIR